MKKIGIITYQDAINYGAILQANSLFEFLSINYPDYSFSVINYNSDLIESKASVKRIICNNKISPVRKLKLLFGFVFTKIKEGKFKKISNKFKTTKIYNTNNIMDLNKDFDYFIIGSDQVWNYKLNHGDLTYFLNCVYDKNKIFTYASSIGLSEIDTEHKLIFRDNLSNVKMISVREKSASNLLENLLKRKIPVVVDPVLLFGKEYWQKKISKKKAKNNKTNILVYFFNKVNVDSSNVLIKREIKTPYIVNKLNGSISFLDFLSSRVKVSYSSGPLDFLKGIANSDYVMTDSFHCVVFSIIYHKKFLFFPNGSTSETSSRIIDLLDYVGLKDNIYDINNPTINKTKTIRWEEVDKKIEKLRKKSIDYLNSIISIIGEKDGINE